jgi:hypothetical protein
MSSSSNEYNATFEAKKNISNTKIFDEFELISSNKKIPNTNDSSNIVEIRPNNIISAESSINSSISSHDLIFGTPIEILKPKKIGKMYAFLYINNFPLIVIGPDCKYFKYLILYIR